MERIPCEPEPLCKYLVGYRGCHESVHHLFHPANEYTTPLEKRFRQLPINKVLMCRMLHDLEHIVHEPPPKPHIDDMRQIIMEHQNGTITE